MHILSHHLAILRTFADEHDNIPAFHAVYLVLVLMAAMLFNLGVFGVLILIHMSLDIVKYRDVHKFSWGNTFKAMAHENLIDVTLFFVALVFSVYFHHSVGMIGISGLLRAELTIMHLFGTVVPKFIILEDFLKVISHLHHYLEQIHPDFHKGWTRLDKIYLSFIGTAVLLLIMAPNIMHVDPSVVQWVVLWELVPWNI